MKFVIAGSGSSGNSTIISSNDTNIIIDFSLSKKRVNEALSLLNLTLDDIDGFLIIHEHADHISQANKNAKNELLYALKLHLKNLELQVLNKLM